MKVFQSLAFLASALLFAAKVSAEAEGVEQLFHVTVSKPALDAAIAKFGDDLDIWGVKAVADNKVKADIYASDDVIAKFYTSLASKNSILSTSATPQVSIERDPVNTAELLKVSAEIQAECTTSTLGHLAALNSTANYIDNAFFDCWRTAPEVYEFLDALAAENSQIVTKFDSISTSYEGRPIPAYKISTGATTSTGKEKKAIFTQGLIHAREWHAGSTTFYAIASILDGLRSGDATITSLVDEYDWYFVPIFNIDGFLYTFNGNRLWRKNRRPVTTSGRVTYGIDLNRNFGPLADFGKAGDGPSSSTYPGPKPLSEPETAGVFSFLKSIPNLAGVLDIHAYSGLVLRPFGNREEEAAAPYGEKLKTLGDNVESAIAVDNDQPYTSQTAAELYLCYGTVLDSIFLEFNQTATLSFEMEGDNFVVPESVIRPGGKHVFQGILQFAKELEAYYS
ncbi:Carboxypeptidase [Globisporangium polare]